MTCSTCSAPLASDASFCVECGTQVGGPAPAASTFEVPLGLEEARHEPTLARAFSMGGAVNENQNYLGQRMVFDREGIEAFNPAAFTGRDLLRRVLRGIIVASLLLLFTLPVAAVLIFVLPDALIKPLLVLFYLGAFVAIVIVEFRRRLVLALSEWRFVLDGRADAEGSVLLQIRQELLRRGTPFDRVRGHRTANGRTYLELSRAPFTAYVSCFSLGNDLYVGWTMWWSVSPWQHYRTSRIPLLQRLKNWFGDGTSEVLETTLRADEGKAFREVVHNATRSGVEVASGALDADAEAPALPMEFRDVALT